MLYIKLLFMSLWHEINSTGYSCHNDIDHDTKFEDSAE